MDLREPLKHIPPSDLDYQQWVNVGMALKHEGFDCSVWDEWSQADGRYKTGDCEKKWKTFNEGSGSIVTGGTIVELAKQYGWMPQTREIKTFDFDDYIEYDGDPDVVIKDTAWIDSSNIVVIPNDKDFDGANELRRYLQALFKPDDIIGYCVDATQDEKGKWRPSSKGVADRTVKELLTAIKKHPKDIADTIGDYQKAAGAWIRFNPLDGQGVGNVNVTDYRYALVESDSLEIEKQKALMEELKLPIAIMVHSGGKSVHAIVRIDAVNVQDYREKVDYLYKVCEKNGLIIDTQNKNPSRLSRMPGVYRGDKKQFIIAENIGCKTFDEWKSYIEDLSDDYPDIIDFGSLDKMPELAPELISGILRRGHKMLIAGPSKAGKSFLLAELALCIIYGKKWLGFRCKPGKVLYINLEVDGDSFTNRIEEVRKVMGLDKPDKDKLFIWNLRGQNANINKLAPRLIRRAMGKGYDAIIFDPLYKINEGDENSASEMGKFFNQLDYICTQLKTSIICCHHHSKGSQGGKFSIDRASGSGVFARDPDALLDMIQINPRDVGKSLEKGQTAWRIAATLREFQTPDDIDVIFDYPVHHITDELKDAKPMSGQDAQTNSMRGNGVKAEQAEARYQRLIDFITNWDEYDPGPAINHKRAPNIDDAVKYFNQKGFSARSIRRWIDEHDDIKIVNGLMFLSGNE